MKFTRDHVETWLRGSAPDERLISHLVVATWRPIVVRRSSDRSGLDDHHAEELRVVGDEVMAGEVGRLGLAPSRRVASHVDAGFYALTETRLIFGSRSGLRNRPKDLVHSAPAHGVRVYWFDHDESAGTSFRHVTVDFGDGSWRQDRSGLTALGKDLTATANTHHFFTALGSRSVALGR